MARVTVEDCLEKVNNRFALTVLAGRRARALSENRGVPLVECDNKVGVTALREVSAGGVRFAEDVDGTLRDYIAEQRAALMQTSGGDQTFLEAAPFGTTGDGEDDGAADLEELTADLASLGTGDAEGEDEEAGNSDGLTETDADGQETSESTDTSDDGGEGTDDDDSDEP